MSVIEQFQELGKEFIGRAEPKYEHVFPAEPEGVRLPGTSGRARLPAPTVMALCRYRRTGVWRPTEPASG